jgi:hypothetical protein
MYSTITPKCDSLIRAAVWDIQESLLLSLRGKIYVCKVYTLDAAFAPVRVKLRDDIHDMLTSTATKAQIRLNSHYAPTTSRLGRNVPLTIRYHVWAEMGVPLRRQLYANMAITTRLTQLMSPFDQLADSLRAHVIEQQLDQRLFVPVSTQLTRELSPHVRRHTV